MAEVDAPLKLTDLGENLKRLGKLPFEMPAEETPEWYAVQGQFSAVYQPLDLLKSEDVKNLAALMQASAYRDKPRELVEAAIFFFATHAAGGKLVELKRLQEENPVQRILAAYQSALEQTPHHDDTDSMLKNASDHIAPQANQWQDAVSRTEGIDLLKGTQRNRKEVIEDLLKPTQHEGEKYQRGEIVKTISGGRTDRLNLSKDFFPRLQEAKGAATILHELGFMNENVGIDALFSLEIPKELEGRVSFPEFQTEKLMREAKPTRISFDRVIGLTSASLLGVVANVSLLGGDRIALDFVFSPEAIVRSIPPRNTVLVGSSKS